VQPTENRIVANGLSHRVLAWDGGGDTVVLTHGFLDDATSFGALAERLATAGHRVVAFDWRGHGETERVAVGCYYHFADYVLDLEELLPQLSDPPPHLVGHSMGGTACALYAGTRPHAIRSLTLIEGIGPPATPPSAAPQRFVAWLDSVRAMRDKVARHPDRPWRGDPLHRTTSPIRFDVEAFEAFLARIEVPTLYVAGDDGFRLPDEAARVAKIQGARMVELRGGHMLHRETPDALADALLAFLSAL
jgi:pimeloyl-ACP methyl ester carboxylesterase